MKYNLRPHPLYGFLQIQPTPSLAEIARFYAEEFYSAYPRFNDSALEAQVKDQEWLDARRQEVCDSIKKISGRELRGLRVLDIGCGWGEALNYFQKQGMLAYGFDPVPEAIEYGRKKGLNVVVAGMEKMSVFEKERFDVVCLFNVLEHLADPVAVLDEIRQSVLVKDGILIVDVPNEFNPFQTCANEVLKLDEWWVAPPGHLNYFSRDTLSALVTGCGLEIRLAESSFPMEMFLLFGDNYVRNGEIGRISHRKRIAFETHLRRTGRGSVLRAFYEALATLNIGRQITIFAVNK